MKVNELLGLINGRLVCGDPDKAPQFDYAFASDLMSDVLTLDHISPLLITGLSNLQTIRTAEMADIHTIVLARGKRASEEMIALAELNDLLLIETPYSVFRTSGILYQHGLKPIF